MVDQVSKDIWDMGLSSIFQAYIERAFASEYCDIVTLYKRVIKVPQLMDPFFMKVLSKEPEEKWSPSQDLDVVAELFENLSASTSLKEMINSTMGKSIKGWTNLMHYYWIYLFWRVIGEEEVMSSESLRHLVDGLITDMVTDQTDEFRLSLVNRRNESKMELIPYLLGSLDETTTKHRYERRHLKDGAVLSYFYMQ